MTEKDELPVSAPEVTATDGSVDEVGGIPVESGEPGKTKATFVQKVKGLVGDFVDYAKNTEL